MMDNNTIDDSSNLVSLVRAARPYQLLHMLKQTHPETDALDKALHEAVWMGHVLCASILLSSGANIKSVNQYGEPLLVEAAYSESPDMLEFLLQKGYEVNFHVGDAASTGTVVPLHVAVMKNMLRVTEMLLAAGVNTECRNSEGNTVLIVACQNDNRALIELLLVAKCIVNATGSSGNTALHTVADRGLVDSMKLLLNHGADPNLENDEGNTSSHVACDSGSYDCLAVLAVWDRTELTRANKEQKNCLHFAAAAGNRKMVSTLMMYGVCGDCKDVYGNTPLIIATFLRNTGFAFELLRHSEVAVNAEGEQRRTALHWACHHGHEQLVRELLAREEIQKDKRDEKSDTPFIVAVMAKEVAIAKHLIETGCDIAMQGDHGRSSLHWAAIHGLVGVLEAILHADGGVTMINASDDDGNSPLLLAAMHRHYIEMRSLLQYKEVDANLVGELDRTALHWICMRGYNDMVQKLLARSARADLPDIHGDTPLVSASKHHNEHVVRELIDAGVNTNAVGQHGRTALHHACSANMLACVRLLLAVKQTDVNIRDEAGNTPLIIAASVANEAMVKTLLEANSCDVNAVGEGGVTTLFLAAEKGLEPSCRLLLEHGAETDNDHSTSSALLCASKQGYTHIVQHLLKYKATVDRVDTQHRSALLWAAEGGYLAIIKSLLLRGADAMLQDVAGHTALTLAALSDHADVIQVMLPFSEIDHWENVTQMSALHLAVANNSRLCSDLLMESGARLDIPTARGNNVLLTAAIHAVDHRLLSIILASKRAPDIDCIGEKGRSAIHWLVGDPASLKVLLAYSPVVDRVDDNGASALLFAIAHQQPASSRLLLEAGCNGNMLHQDGRRPIHHAAIYGDHGTLALLLDRGTSPDSNTEDGRTPLLLAAIEGHLEVTRELLLRGCQLNRVYCSAITALSMAATNRHYDVMRLHLDAGAKPDLIGPQKHRPLISCVLNNDCAGAILLMQAGASLSAIKDEKQEPLELAIIKGFSQLVHIITAASYDVNLLSKLLKQGLLHYFISNDELLQKLKLISKTPPSLQVITRKVIQDTTRAPIQTNLKQLPMPTMVKDFLTMRQLPC